MARQMKDSGIAWIDEIPEEWEVARLKQVFDFGKGLPITKEDLVDKGIPVISYGQIHAKSNTGVAVQQELIRYVPDVFRETNCGSSVSKNDFILADTSEDLLGCGNCVFVDREMELFAGYHTIILRSTTTQDNKYLAYLFLTDAWRSQIRSKVSGVKLFSISRKILSEATVLVPSTGVRRRIAAFLDRRCAEIDAVMERTKATIEEYKKLKQAVITEAVTKGVRGPRKMKDSGIEWIGEIPEGWDMVKITRILDYDVPYPIGDGDHGLISPDDYQDDGIPYLRVQNLGWGTQLNLDGLVYISAEINERVKNSTLHPNDVLFAKTGATIGKTGIVPENMPMANTTSHVGKITVAPRYSAMWVFYVLSSHVGYRQFWQIAQQKTTRPELAIAEIKAICLPMPSDRAEQDEIVEYLKVRCAELEKMISSKETLLTELETYKKSVIYEYVTGKKQV